MKYRPIILSAESVLQTITGEKTETRRLITRAHEPAHADAGDDPHEWYTPGYVNRSNDEAFSLYDLPCPLGQKGDRLYVKEQYARPMVHNYISDLRDDPPEKQRAETIYRAEHARSVMPFDLNIMPADFRNLDEGTYYPPTWLGPLLMPRHLSRLTLEIDGVRAERLHSITQDGLKAEGDRVAWQMDGPEVRELRRLMYALRWDVLNGHRGERFKWEANPWVWVITYHLVHAELLDKLG